MRELMVQVHYEAPCDSRIVGLVRRTANAV